MVAALQCTLFDGIYLESHTRMNGQEVAPMTGLRELTAEEQARPYSRYYYRPHAGASPGLVPLYAAMGGVVA